MPGFFPAGPRAMRIYLSFLLGLFLLLLSGSEFLAYINIGPLNFGDSNLVFRSETLGSQIIVKMCNDVESHSCKM